MKILTSLLFVYCMAHAYSAVGQVADSTKINQKFVYAELLGTEKFFSSKITITIDFGQSKSMWKDNRLKDEITGKVQVFNSMIDALNYMGEDGWEFVQAYIVTIGQQNVYHWLLKKRK